MKEYLIEFYLEYFNNYLTIDRYAEHVGMSVVITRQLIDIGRALNNNNTLEYYLDNNDRDWYVVEYDNGEIDLKHSSSLSNILECGHDPVEYNIVQMHQCSSKAQPS